MLPPSLKGGASVADTRTMTPRASTKRTPVAIQQAVGTGLSSSRRAPSEYVRPMSEPLPRSAPHLVPGDEHDRLLVAMEDFLSEAKALRQTLAKREAATRATMRRLDRGAEIDDLIFPCPANTDDYRELTVRIEALELARLKCRRGFVEVGRSEGLSIGEIARRWGFSRQLVARYAR